MDFAGVNREGSERLISETSIVWFLFLSIFTFTLPLAAGTFDEVKNDCLCVHEVKNKPKNKIVAKTFPMWKFGNLKDTLKLIMIIKFRIQR